MKIFNTQIYGLNESIIRSGYPKKEQISETYIAYSEITKKDEEYLTMEEEIWNLTKFNKNLKRCEKLGSTLIGTGHSNFLKGIVVQCDITAPQYWWQQAQRYHWFDIVSSQSKMHTITKMNLSKECTIDTDLRAINIANEYIDLYKQGKISFECVLDNIPMGLEYTAGITTNYLQLKTMYLQRENHKLKGWNTIFKRWVEGLPYIKELGVVKNS